MTIQLIAAVLDHETTTTGLDRLVLIALANHANERGECWPSAATIAREANASVGRTREALKRLIDAGLVERHINAAPDRRIPNDKRTNLYIVHTPTPVPRDVAPATTTDRGTGDPDGYHDSRSAGTTDRGTKTPLNPQHVDESPLGKNAPAREHTPETIANNLAGVAATRESLTPAPPASHTPDDTTHKEPTS